MAIITKTGFGPFGKTIVTANGQTRTFAKSAEVAESSHGLCVTEHRLFGNETTCFIGDKGPQSLADGTVVGSSRAVEITRTDGGTRRYESQLLGVNRVEKQGNDIVVMQNGLFGDKEIGRHRASDVAAVKADDCNVCREINPLYGTAKK
jgi:hypothetical protein